MFKYSFSLVVVVASLLQLHVAPANSKSLTIFPTCTGTGFPNFSYAKYVRVATAPTTFNQKCNVVNTATPTSPITMNWFYYDTYPPAACGNQGLPDGDQCCHSTAASAQSTLTFNTTIFVNTLAGAVGVSTGYVTAGAFIGQSVVLQATRVTGNVNCATAYGQESRVYTVSVTITNGPQCLAGTQLEELCPGAIN